MANDFEEVACLSSESGKLCIFRRGALKPSLVMGAPPDILFNFTVTSPVDVKFEVEGTATKTETTLQKGHYVITDPRNVADKENDSCADDGRVFTFESSGDSYVSVFLPEDSIDYSKGF